ncbi:MAG: hypothetical protein C5B49_09445 [Bdellovibrio sp.]|nr:MAG: hypothetical protein C5B49_09445 [Bdellovibrio sp.]
MKSSNRYSWRLDRKLKAQNQSSHIRGVQGAAVALFIYGVVAGLAVIEPKEFIGFPEHGISFPPVLIIARATTAIGLTIFLSDSFSVEVARVDFILRRMRDEFSTALAHDVQNVVGAVMMAGTLYRQTAR